MENTPPNSHDRLYWACRRGMLELDLILIPFLEQGYQRLTEEQKMAFQRLLDQSDPELLSWLMGYSLPEEPALIDIVLLVQHHAHSGEGVGSR